MQEIKDLYVIEWMGSYDSLETLLVRYLSNLPGAKMMHSRKRLKDPCKPIAVVSRWQTKMTDDQHLHDIST